MSEVSSEVRSPLADFVWLFFVRVRGRLCW